MRPAEFIIGSTVHLRSAVFLNLFQIQELIAARIEKFQECVVAYDRKDTVLLGEFDFCDIVARQTSETREIFDDNSDLVLAQSDFRTFQTRDDAFIGNRNYVTVFVSLDPVERRREIEIFNVEDRTDFSPDILTDQVLAGEEEPIGPMSCLESVEDHMTFVVEFEKQLYVFRGRIDGNRSRNDLEFYHRAHFARSDFRRLLQNIDLIVFCIFARKRDYCGVFQNRYVIGRILHVDRIFVASKLKFNMIACHYAVQRVSRVLCFTVVFEFQITPSNRYFLSNFRVSFRIIFGKFVIVFIFTGEPICFRNMRHRLRVRSRVRRERES